MYKVVTKGSPNEVWASGFYSKEKAQEKIDTGMKNIEYLKPFPMLLLPSKGHYLDIFEIAGTTLIAVQNKKQIEIIFDGISFYNNFGRESMTLAELRTSLEISASRTENFSEYVQNWCNKQKELPIKEKE